jgi:hypothetical protein
VAVVQISKIQLRRGRKNSATGLPQLSSGEMGWAIDTQELYIGNGAVSEGAPAVGNTKILTETDDLFEIAKDYTYKEGTGSVTTGPDSSNPVVRTLQERLDDSVTIAAFGATGVATQDATVLLQRAIDQLYLNNGNESNVSNRVVLNLLPGVYKITDTIYIPPNATIVGAGADKTIIRQDTAGKSIFTTVSDESSPGNYIINGEYNTQARNIKLTGMKLETTADSKGLVLQSCRDSYFENITIVGPWINTDGINEDSETTSSVGMMWNSKNGGVETVRNEFTNCHVDGFAYGIVSNWDINDNVISTSNFSNLGYGIAFGKNLLIDGNVANGTSTGPHNNIISDCVFTNIYREAILVTEGTYNVSRGNKFNMCGNDGGSDAQPIYPVIRFSVLGNESTGDFFTRTKKLSYTQGEIVTGSATITAGQSTIDIADTSNITAGQLVTIDSGIGEFGASTVTITDVQAGQITVNLPHLVSGFIQFSIISSIITAVPYIPEVDGPCNFNWGFEHQVTVRDGTQQTVFRLPKLANQSFDIDYVAQGESGYSGLRSGKIRIVMDNSSNITVSDDYDFVGDNIYVDNISFDAILSDIDIDGTDETILVKSNVAGSLASNATTKMKFKVQTKQIVI